MKHHQTELRVSTQLDDGEKEEEDRGLLLLPERVSHTISKDSPLYSMSPEDLLSSKIEIILTMEGIVEPSGNTTQARTSYLADEVLWGFRFVNSVEYDSGFNCVDYGSGLLTVWSMMIMRGFKRWTRRW